MVTVLIQIAVNADEIQRFQSLTRANLSKRLRAPGAIDVKLYKDQKQPQEFTLIEIFDSQESIDAYYQTSEYKEWHKAVGPLILSWKGSDQTNALELPGALEGVDNPSKIFSPSVADLESAVARVHLQQNGTDAQLPANLPIHGLGETHALDLLAPIVLGHARRLDAPDSFDHMDPPTPWVTWATTLWNAALNQNLLHPDTAPVARSIEQRVVAWLAPLFGMQSGHMTPGSTVSNLTALWAARETRGVNKVAASEAAHLSIEKAAHILGMEFIKIPTDHLGAMDPANIPTDLRDTALVLTAGTTSAGAIDPLVWTGEPGWVHVDAAWAGPMMLSESHKAFLAGVENADSVAISAHKWLFQPKESALVLFRDANASIDAVSFGGSYLKVPNVGLLGSASARAVPLMATLLAFGQNGIASLIDEAILRMDGLYKELSEMPGVVTFKPPNTGVLLWRPTSRSAESVIEKLPVGMSSLTKVNEMTWLRQVAANPMAEIDLIFATIRSVVRSE